MPFLAPRRHNTPQFSRRANDLDSRCAHFVLEVRIVVDRLLGSVPVVQRESRFIKLPCKMSIKHNPSIALVRRQLDAGAILYCVKLV